MNKPLSEAELQERMMKYNAEVVGKITELFTRPITPPSDQSIRWARERKLQNRLFAALNEVREAVSEANAHSEVMSINIGGFEDWLHDEGILGRNFWDHKISQAGE